MCIVDVSVFYYITRFWNSAVLGSSFILSVHLISNIFCIVVTENLAIAIGYGPMMNFKTSFDCIVAISHDCLQNNLHHHYHNDVNMIIYHQPNILIIIIIIMMMGIIWN